MRAASTSGPSGTAACAGLTVLRPLRADLFDLHAAWVNDPDVGWGVFGAPQARSAADERAWFDEQLRESAAVFRLIYRSDDLDRPIGVASLTAFDPAERLATFRILIGSPEDRGHGFGRDASRQMLAYGFDELGLSAIGLDVFAYNTVARRLYRRFGFRETGRRRGRIEREGRRWDVIRMALRAEEFRRGP